ncbi:MAG: hypothetical protein JWM68_1064 [Verrucomicrobiales bacterium]|nr:hypothetical protein [Verrucomicrobiales bacterium]
MPTRIAPIRILIALTLLLGGVCFAESVERKNLATGVYLGEYSTNWPRCVFMDSSESKVSIAVTPNVGGRIVSYSLNGDNILFDGAAVGRRNMAGGYQCDIGPETLDLPEHPVLWSGGNGWQFKPWNVKLMSDPDDVTGVEIDKEITLEPDTGELGLTQWIKNISTNDVSYCIWDRTLCKSGGFVFFRLNPESFYPSGWAIHPEFDASFHFEKGKYSSPHIKNMDGVLVIEANGKPTQIGADSRDGWIAYVRGDLLFVKYFQVFPKADYTDDANTIEIFFNEQVAELQLLSPEVALKPKQNYSFPEKWTLIHLDKRVTTFKQARKLADKIPPSPFKN